MRLPAAMVGCGCRVQYSCGGGSPLSVVRAWPRGASDGDAADQRPSVRGGVVCELAMAGPDGGCSRYVSGGRSDRRDVVWMDRWLLVAVIAFRIRSLISRVERVLNFGSQTFDIDLRGSIDLDARLDLKRRQIFKRADARESLVEWPDVIQMSGMASARLKSLRCDPRIADASNLHRAADPIDGCSGIRGHSGLMPVRNQNRTARGLRFMTKNGVAFAAQRSTPSRIANPFGGE